MNFDTGTPHSNTVPMARGRLCLYILSQATQFNSSYWENPQIGTALQAIAHVFSLKITLSDSNGDSDILSTVIQTFLLTPDSLSNSIISTATDTDHFAKILPLGLLFPSFLFSHAIIFL